jgi:hypothetical protein
LHHGFDIRIGAMSLNFSMDIDKAAGLLDQLSYDKKQLADDEFFYKDLKLTISSSEAMGGDGKELAYFYCSKDITHLLEK